MLPGFLRTWIINAVEVLDDVCLSFASVDDCLTNARQRVESSSVISDNIKRANVAAQSIEKSRRRCNFHGLPVLGLNNGSRVQKGMIQ